MRLVQMWIVPDTESIDPGYFIARGATTLEGVGRFEQGDAVRLTASDAELLLAHDAAPRSSTGRWTVRSRTEVRSSGFARWETPRRATRKSGARKPRSWSVQIAVAEAM